MASNDPTDTGGLFIGRRPGTGPVRYNEVEPPSERRRAADNLLAHFLLGVERDQSHEVRAAVANDHGL